MAVVSPKCPWVNVTHGEDVKVLAVDYVPESYTGGRLGLYVDAYYRNKLRYGVPYGLVLPGSIDHFATMKEFNISLDGTGFDPAHGGGPVTIVCGDAKVEGIGLPLNHHVQYVITFRVMSDEWQTW